MDYYYFVQSGIITDLTSVVRSGSMMIVRMMMLCQHNIADKAVIALVIYIVSCIAI